MSDIAIGFVQDAINAAKKGDDMAIGLIITSSLLNHNFAQIIKKMADKNDEVSGELMHDAMIKALLKTINYLKSTAKEKSKAGL